MKRDGPHDRSTDRRFGHSSIDYSSELKNGSCYILEGVV